MIDQHINNPKSIKYYVNRYLQSKKDELIGKIVLDVPAGNGASCEILQQLGAKVEAYDLFPEYFMLKSMTCTRANIKEGLPVADNYADALICQEGIEHFSDPSQTFKEFNRVLKMGGKVILTTPSYSNLRARYSYMLMESEFFNKLMPPNEIDSIWMADNSVSSEIYHGHIFLLGIQKLRVLTMLNGFKIEEMPFVRLSKTSLWLFPFFYPFIFISSYLAYFKAMRKNPQIPKANKEAVYKAQLKLAISPRILLDEHIFVVFEKETETKDVYAKLQHRNLPFDKIM
jgi:SAM-dependent methyltransferase